MAIYNQPQDPHRDELRRQIRESSVPRASEVYAQGVPMKEMLIRPQSGPTLSDIEQQRHDARIWQAKLDALNGGDIWRHAKQETWTWPSGEGLGQVEGTLALWDEILAKDVSGLSVNKYGYDAAAEQREIQALLDAHPHMTRKGVARLAVLGRTQGSTVPTGRGVDITGTRVTGHGRTHTGGTFDKDALLIKDYNDLLPDLWKEEPGWVISWEEFKDITKDVPGIAHEDIRNAKSMAHAVAIAEQAKARMAEIGMMHEKYALGPMMLAYIGAGVVDPVNLSLMIGGAGVYKQAANIAKYSRLARFARVGALAATEAAGVVGVRAADDPLLDERHVIMAAAVSGVIGGTIGAARKSTLTHATEVEPGMALNRQAWDDMPEAPKGTWEGDWNVQRPPIFFELSLDTSVKWGNVKGGRILMVGDRAKNRGGFIFEGADGNTAFRVDQDGVVTYWSTDYKISGVWDTKTGRVVFNMETMELKQTLREAALDIDSPGHPLKVEQQIEETIRDFFKLDKREGQAFRDGAVKAQKNRSVPTHDERRIVRIKEELQKPGLSEKKKGELIFELRDLEKRPRVGKPKYHEYADDFDIDEESAIGGTKGIVYDSQGFGKMPAHGIETIEALSWRAAEAHLGPLATQAQKESYANMFHYPLMRHWNTMTGRLVFDNLTEYDLMRQAMKFGMRDPETGLWIPRREFAEMDPVAYAKLTKRQRAVVARDQAALIKENKELEIQANAAYKKQLIDLGGGTNKMFLNRIVVGPDTNVDSPIGIVTKVFDDGTVEVNMGAIHGPRAERVVAPSQRADRAAREAKQAARQRKQQRQQIQRAKEIGPYEKYRAQGELDASGAEGAIGGVVMSPRQAEQTARSVKNNVGEEASDAYMSAYLQEYTKRIEGHLGREVTISESIGGFKKAWPNAVRMAEEELAQRRAEIAEAPGGPPTRETDPGDPYRPVEEADVIRDPESIMHPERLQTFHMDEVTPLSPSVLSREFLETDIKLTISKLAPLTDSQKSKLFNGALSELTHPERLVIAQRLREAKALVKSIREEVKKKQTELLNIKKKHDKLPPSVYGYGVIVPEEIGTLGQGTTVWMTPDEFLSISTPYGWEPDIRKLKKLRKSLYPKDHPTLRADGESGRGELLNTAPSIKLHAMFGRAPGPAPGSRLSGHIVKAHQHEGRHRAIVLKEMGQKYIPVLVTMRGTPSENLTLKDLELAYHAEIERLSLHSTLRNAYDDAFFPTHIESEFTKETIPFPRHVSEEAVESIREGKSLVSVKGELLRRFDNVEDEIFRLKTKHEEAQAQAVYLFNRHKALGRFRGKRTFNLVFDSIDETTWSGMHPWPSLADPKKPGWAIQTEHGLAGVKGTPYRPEFLPEGIHGDPTFWEIGGKQGYISTELVQPSNPVGFSRGTPDDEGSAVFHASHDPNYLGPIYKDVTVVPKHIWERVPVLDAGFGTSHLLEVLRSIQKHNLVDPVPKAFRNSLEMNGMKPRQDDYEAMRIYKMYELLEKAGVPFERWTVVQSFRNLTYDEAAGAMSKGKIVLTGDRIQEPLIIPFQISAKALDKVNLNNVAKNLKKLLSREKDYTPKQYAMEYTGVGPSGEPFTLDVYPDLRVYVDPGTGDLAGIPGLGEKASVLYSGGEPGVVGPRSTEALSEATRSGLNWNGPKEYKLRVRGGSEFGYDLKATNLKDAKAEIKEFFLDRVLRKESEELKEYWRTQPEREALAEQGRIEGEVLMIALGIRRLELEQVSDILSHIPEHLRMRRWDEVNARIRSLLNTWEPEEIPVASTRHIDPGDVQIILPNGKIIDMVDLPKVHKRPKKVVIEALDSIATYEKRIGKWQDKIAKTRDRIVKIKDALKSKDLSKEDKATLNKELKELQNNNRSANAKLRKLEKDLADVEKVEAAAEPWWHAKRAPQERTGTFIYDQESGEMFFLRSKKTGKTRSVDDIIDEAEKAGAAARANKASVRNAENPGRPSPEAFDDTPHGMDEIVDGGARSFDDTGWGAKVTGIKLGIKGMFNSIGNKTKNMPLSGMYRWMAMRIGGGLVDEVDQGSWRGPLRKGKTLRPVEGESPWGRRGIEEGRDEMVKMRLAFFDHIQKEFQTWRKLNQKGFMSYWTNTAQDEFGEILGRVKNDRTGKVLAELPEHSHDVIRRGVQKAIEHFDGELKFLQKYGKGWEDVISDPHYVPRFWDRAKIAMHRGRLGLNIADEELAKVFQKGLLAANKQAREAAQAIGEKGPRELSEAEAYKFGEKFLKSIGNNKFRLNLINDASHQKATAIELAKILEMNFGYTAQEALDIAATFRVTEKKARHQMFRIRLDTEILTTVLNRKGEPVDVRLGDLIDYNIFTGARRYARHTSSKILIQDMIDEANIKLGRPNHFKNLDDMVEVVLHDLEHNKGVTGRELERWTKYMDSLARIARDQPFSEATDAALGMQLSRQIAYSMGHGALFGVSALAEASSANWVQGVKGFIESMPALRRMVGGVTEVDKVTLREFAASLGMGIRERIIPRMDLMGRIVEEGGSTALGRQAVMRRLWMGASRMMTEVSGLMKITEWSDHVALKRHMVHYGNMMIRGEYPNDIRLVDMGLTRKEWDRISRQVRKQYKRQTSVDGVDTYQYNFSEWDDQGAVDLFAQAIQAEVKSVVQRQSRMDMPTWYFANPTAHELTKIALQYRGFGMSSINNYVVRNLRASDARALYVLASSVAGGALAFMIKGMLAHEDTPEGREKFKERMSLGSIARGAFLHSGFTFGLENATLFSGPLLGYDVYGNYHRRGLSNSWMDQVRTMSYADDVTGMMQSFIQTGVLDNRDFTQADYRRVQRVFGIMRHPLIAPFVKDLGNGLPTKSR